MVPQSNEPLVSDEILLEEKISHLATTATATLKSQRAICDSLQLKQPVIILVNPDRRNIFFESQERPGTGEINYFLYCILCATGEKN